jgi:ribosomal protein L11 methylase PrmA
VVLERVERFDLRAAPAPQADVLTANLMRPLLLEVARRMDHRPGALIASGLLEEEAEEVAMAFEPLQERGRLTDRGWSALLLERGGL